jgi:hypothetical protein
MVETLLLNSFAIIVNAYLYNFFFFGYWNGYFTIIFEQNLIAFDSKLWITWMILSS